MLIMCTLNAKAGCDINMGDFVYEPPRDGPTMWEIGIPDRSAAEFYIPDPNPTYINKLYVNHADRLVYLLFRKPALKKQVVMLIDVVLDLYMADKYKQMLNGRKTIILTGYFFSGRFRQYGLWERYADLYPDKDLVYTIGLSDYTKDWFFAQVNRYTSPFLF